MNKTVAESLDLANGLVRELKDVTEVDIAICPPFTALSEVSKVVIDSNIRLGAQNMSENGYGAHTGEIAAGMLKEFSAKYVILGHSERRQYQRESDELVAAKAKAAHEAGLKPIVCVGEQLEDRESGRTEEIVGSQVRGSVAGLTADQMEGTVVAYEPVWAIGTGKTATAAQAQEVHAFIRNLLSDMFDEATASHVRIQYGGSVKPQHTRVDEPSRRGRSPCGWRLAGREKVFRDYPELDLRNKKRNHELPDWNIDNRPRPELLLTRTADPDSAAEEGVRLRPSLRRWRD